MNATVIILAGGKGKRMGQDAPKVLTLLNGLPLIKYVTSAVIKSNTSDKIVIVIGYKGEMVKNFLGEKFVYAKQMEQLGTGHAVLCAQKVSVGAKNIIVLYGDMPNVSSETIKNLAQKHNLEQSVLTMMTTKVPNFDGIFNCFKSFGRIVRDSAGAIVRIVEEKDATEEEKNITEVNPSLFCFDGAWLWDNLPKLKNFNAQEEYYLTDLVGLSIEGKHKIASLEIDPLECIGVNTPEELELAEQIKN